MKSELKAWRTAAWSLAEELVAMLAVLTAQAAITVSKATDEESERLKAMDGHMGHPSAKGAADAT